MNIRTKIRRWRMGADLHDRATAAVALAAISEGEGRERAWAFVRNLHAEYGPPKGRCTVPDCCPDVTAETFATQLAHLPETEETP